MASLDALEGLEDRELSGSLRYALGNYAVMRGALEEARDYYVDVLRLSPDDEDAKANLELVLGLLLPPPVELPPSDAPPPGDGPGDGEGRGIISVAAAGASVGLIVGVSVIVGVGDGVGVKVSVGVAVGFRARMISWCI